MDIWKEILHMPCIIGSINEIHARLNENGYHISKRMLRQMVADGLLPFMPSGNKMLINYDYVVELLLTHTAVSSRS